MQVVKARGGRWAIKLVDWEVTEACARDRTSDVTQNGVEVFCSCTVRTQLAFETSPVGHSKRLWAGHHIFVNLAAYKTLSATAASAASVRKLTSKYHVEGSLKPNQRVEKLRPSPPRQEA